MLVNMYNMGNVVIKILQGKYSYTTVVG